MPILKRITVDLAQDTHYRGLANLVRPLRGHQLQLHYDIELSNFQMLLDNKEIEELVISKYTTYNLKMVSSLIDSVFGMAFDHDYLDVSILHPYAYGYINMTAKGQRLKVAINDEHKYEKHHFDREYLNYQPVLNHRVLTLYDRLLTSQPISVECFEDIYSVMQCLEVEDVVASKALHDDFVVITELKHRSALPQEQLEQYIRNLIINYLQHSTDLQALKDHTLSGDITHVKVNLHISNINQKSYSKINGFTLGEPRPRIYQEYLVNFVCTHDDSAFWKEQAELSNNLD